MKYIRLISILLLLASPMLLLAGPSADPCETFDYSVVEKKSHPRIIINDGDLRAIKKQLSVNPQLKAINDAIIDVADKTDTRGKPLTYELDASGSRLLAISRQALSRIVANAYAYRVTGHRRYLKAAQEDILAVCSFKDWHDSHYLDVAEMATAVAIGYDWLYKHLSQATREAAVKAIKDFAFSTSVDAEEVPGFYKGKSNWNQVCNAGLICAALATYESYPDLARRAIVKSVESNRAAISHIYAPDGAYPEGPGYWDYGTSYQVLLLSCLDSVLGTDFGLYDEKGLSSTGCYKIFTDGNAGRKFNFSDSDSLIGASPSLWFFAVRNSDPGLVAMEIPMLGRYGESRLAFISAKYASILGPVTAPGPQRKVYRADGVVPIVMARTGWTGNDLYLGIKGGSADANHGHMDAGEFVFDAYGYRWAIDYTHPGYSALEVKLKPYDEDLFSKRQNAMRWKIYGYNNRQHNTLTINDTDHKVSGRAEIVEVFDEPGRLGGTLDLGKVFDGEVKSAVRSCSITEGSGLEIIDRIEALEGKAAKVRWTMVTEADVTVGDDGIVLDNGRVKMKLSVTGVNAKYRTWPSSPELYDLPTKDFPAPLEKATLCGFEFEIPAGTAAESTAYLGQE